MAPSQHTGSPGGGVPGLAPQGPPAPPPHHRGMNGAVSARTLIAWPLTADPVAPLHQGACPTTPQPCLSACYQKGHCLPRKAHPPRKKGNAEVNPQKQFGCSLLRADASACTQGQSRPQHLGPPDPLGPHQCASGEPGPAARRPQGPEAPHSELVVSPTRSTRSPRLRSDPLPRSKPRATCPTKSLRHPRSEPSPRPWALPALARPSTAPLALGHAASPSAQAGVRRRLKSVSAPELREGRSGSSREQPGNSVSFQSGDDSR